MPREGTIDELRDWELNGAVWRPFEVHPALAVVDLCSCSGELMERVESADPEFIAFVQGRDSE